MITYPTLKNNATIGVTAPSSGVEQELHEMFKQACNRMEEKGYQIECGETLWTQVKAKSAPAEKRAAEFNKMIQDESIDMIIPPWGGELLMEILHKLDFNAIPAKWILGYSDTSVLLLAITLKTGIATAHGTNLVDLRGEYSDNTTAMWEAVLTANDGESIIQHSSEKYQKEWDHENPSPHVFHLTEETVWKTISDEDVLVKGRLLGGCIDVIRHLIGTSYGNVLDFQKNTISGEPILWYFENCDMPTTDLKRTLIQMKLAGWFDNCTGIMFGRSSANHPVEGYQVQDVYREFESELGIPIIYDIDCGHVPPQMTFINGAYAKVKVDNGKGSVEQWLLS
ncbi:S66 family peptidase [Virgibacillus litoralis]|uniref:Muramoyltetrapeptide carboxypeptidase LdcA involved in peptidoglycan recycling n=1 Tax=Virgibacillus litoralis TaxID=578221 RepID=A0ABS4HCD0_9BACI|nr:S66 peptidase family protein [Virgibacillus litoralis]MBP1948570.1 muramoyltetrapeptide carboxypeptidase LdcA involved in peptidoglycan recycling [Virgibacillus litoralis]